MKARKTLLQGIFLKSGLAIACLPAFFSCVSLHTPSPHFVPSISGKNQCEGEVSVGLSSASVNFAYSPLNRLTLMGNVQGLPLNPNSRRYQRNCEMAVGTYGSGKRTMYGLNAGYGMGAYSWD